jgi:prepilin-type N-terminal cleavage/methylation domain-containing protein
MIGRKGFTLIELLVVIAIIGIIASILWFSFIQAQNNARDAVRRSDIASYAKVFLIENAAEKGGFPREDSLCCLDVDPSNPLYCNNAMTSPKVAEVLKAIPKDPKSDGTINHCYRYISNGTSATLSTSLEVGNPYVYLMGTDHALTETGSSNLALVVDNASLKISGSWSRQGTGADKSIVIKKLDQVPSARDEEGTTEIPIGTQENFIDSEVQKDKTYCYSIWNYNSTDNLYSVPFSQCATMGPSPLDIFTASAVNESSSITLNWSKSESEYSTIIRRAVGYTPPQTISEGDAVAVNNIGDVTKTDSGLAAGATYSYAAFSYNNSTNLSSSSLTMTVSTAPTTPTLSVSATSSSVIAITYSIPSGASRVVITRVSPANTWTQTSGTSLNDSSLAAGTQYCYSARSYNSDGKYSGTTANQCATTPYLIPAVPTLTATAASSSTITVGYNLPTNAARTVIERVSPANTWTQTSGASLTDSGLTAGVQYCYRAKSCSTSNDSSCSAYTSNQCATTTNTLGTQANPGASCLALLNSGITTSGNYYINSGGTAFLVYCDMTTSGGGWTIVFRSSDPSPWGGASGTPGTGSWAINMTNRTPAFTNIMVRRVSDGQYKVMTVASSSNIYTNLGGNDGGSTSMTWKGIPEYNYGAYRFGMIYTSNTCGCAQGTVSIVDCYYTSWGFGHLHNINSGQGYAFNSCVNQGAMVLDIGIR